MLKRTAQAARAVANVITASAEAAGISTPSVADASRAADERRVALTEAHAAVTAAEADLEALHDTDAAPNTLHAAEAKVADAKLKAERAQRAYASAERRLISARDAEAGDKLDAARVRLAKAVAIREQAAREIDRLAAEIAQHVRAIDAQDSAIMECVRDGAAPRHSGHTPNMGQRAAELSLSRAGAVPRAYAGNPVDHPGALDVIARANGALIPLPPKPAEIAEAA